MASACQALVDSSFSRAASVMSDMLPIFAVAVGLPLAAMIAFTVRDWFRG